jgi:hypothetical protein
MGDSMSGPEAYEDSTSSGAIQGALALCKGSGCRILGAYDNGCFAFAYKRSFTLDDPDWEHYFGATGETRLLAQQAAVALCVKRTSDEGCHAVLSQCVKVGRDIQSKIEKAPSVPQKKDVPSSGVTIVEKKPPPSVRKEEAPTVGPAKPVAPPSPAEESPSISAKAPADIRSFVSTFDFGMLTKIIVTGAVCLFVVLSLRDFVKRGGHHPRLMLSNAVTVILIACALFALVVSGSFVSPYVTGWIATLHGPDLALLVAVVIGILLFFIPLRFWHGLKQVFAEMRQAPPATSPGTSVSLERAESGLSEGQTASTVPPIQGMQLKLKRSERRSSVRGKPIFMLDARMEVSADILDTIRKYSLGSRVVYESSTREKHREAAMGHLEDSKSDSSVLFAPPTEHLKDAGRTAWKLTRAAVSMGLSALSLRITISSLISGVHVECKDMEELLEAEEAIQTAAINLKHYIDTAGTFDGQEQVVELKQ